MDIFERINICLEIKGWKPAELMRRIPADRSLFAKWKSGRMIPEVRIAQIAELLETSEAYLRGETDDPSATQPPPKESWDDIEVLAASSDIPLNELTPEQQQEVKDFVNYLLSKQKKQ